MTESAAVPATRTARLAQIVEIINREQITSQSQLRDVLKAMGIGVTQATLSRDLEELHAYKDHLADGVRAYRVPDVEMLSESAVGARAQLDRWVAEVTVSVQYALNQVVVKTPPGGAQLLASAIDRAVFEDVLGCIAGDDTVLVITASEKRARALAREIMELAAKKN